MGGKKQKGNRISLRAHHQGIITTTCGSRNRVTYAQCLHSRHTRTQASRYVAAQHARTHFPTFRPLSLSAVADADAGLDLSPERSAWLRRDKQLRSANTTLTSWAVGYQSNAPLRSTVPASREVSSKKKGHPHARQLTSPASPVTGVVWAGRRVPFVGGLVGLVAFG